MYDCPNGAIAGAVYAGDRVYVTGRDESGGWYEVRDPRNQARVLWVPEGAVDPDAVVDVPVRECSLPVELVGAAEESSTTTTTVQTTPVADTVKPTVSQAGRSPDRIYDPNPADPDCPNTSTLTVQATDNVAVTQVTGTYSGLPGGPKAFTKGAGNTWTATFGPFTGLATEYEQNITIIIVARDAAGNTSSATQVSVLVDGAGNCLG